MSELALIMAAVELVLIRGLPGSGKSTLARSMEGYRHYEADQFFEKDGGYDFNPALLGRAHAECLANTRKSLESGRSVVVSNTFTRRSEVKPYLALATELGIPVRVLVATGNYGSVHSVPEETMARMRARWQDDIGV